jgi:hypothetical protein
MYILYLEITSLGVVWAIQKCRQLCLLQKDYGERNTFAKSPFTTITLSLLLMEVNNFDNGEREEKMSGNDQKAQKSQ